MDQSLRSEAANAAQSGTGVKLRCAPRRSATRIPIVVSQAWCLLCCGLAILGDASYCTPDTLSRYPSGWPTQLDYGIYWFGSNDESAKAVDSKKSSFYDPKKPTVIYFHGWTGADEGWTRICKRVTTACPETACPHAGGLPLVEQWLTNGWNVGWFYWDQFADEDCARDAEQKVWFDRKGAGLRWKSFDVGNNSFSYQHMTDIKSLGDLCASVFWTAMDGYKGPEVRFVGHSIGAQLAAHCAAKMHWEQHPASPSRLALLEPYFTKHHLYFFRCKEIKTDEGIGDYTAAATASYVKRLWDTYNVTTEVYKSSVLTTDATFGVINQDLQGVATVVQYEPDWCGGMGPEAAEDLQFLACRHSAVFPFYFLSLQTQPPVLDPPPVHTDAPTSSALLGCPVPSAACSREQLGDWIERQFAVGGAQGWLQKTGTETFQWKDDSFVLSPQVTQAPEFIVREPAPRPHVRFHRPWWKGGKIPTPDFLHKWWFVPAIILLTVSLCCGLLFCHMVTSHRAPHWDSDEETSARPPRAAWAESNVVAPEAHTGANPKLLAHGQGGW